MKNLLPAAAAALLLSGCATMYQSMGLATTADLASRDGKIAALEGRFDSVSEEAKQVRADAKLASEKAAEVEALMKDLQGRVDQLPQETLKKLAEILAKAAAETKAP